MTIDSNETSHHLLVVEVSRAKVVEGKLMGVQVEEEQVRPGGSRTAVDSRLQTAAPLAG